MRAYSLDHITPRRLNFLGSNLLVNAGIPSKVSSPRGIHFTVVYHYPNCKRTYPDRSRSRDKRQWRLPLPFVSWWSQAGSNRRPPACKAGALPAELWPRKIFLLEDMVGLGRFELPTSPLSGVRSNQLSYRPKANF